MQGGEGTRKEARGAGAWKEMLPDHKRFFLEQVS